MGFPNPFRGVPEEKARRGLTAWLIMFLSKQPQMCVEFPLSEFSSFPYDAYELTAITTDQSVLLMLVKKGHCNDA